MEARSFLRSVVHVCLCEAAVCSVLSSEADRMTLRLCDSNLHFFTLAWDKASGVELATPGMVCRSFERCWARSTRVERVLCAVYSSIRALL